MSTMIPTYENFNNRVTLYETFLTDMKVFTPPQVTS